MIPAIASASAWLVPGLLNGLWQGALIAGLCAVSLRLARFSAATRCAVWFGALIGIACLPFLPLCGTNASSVAPQGGRTSATPLAPGPAVPTIPAAAAEAVLLLWAAGSAFCLARLGASCIRLSRLKRNALPLKTPPGLLPRGAAVCSSDLCDSPVMIGLARPVILLPSRMAFTLAPAELNRILRHEAAHVRRLDDWMQLFQRIVEALFFFHPAVRWIARRLELEREVACDDHVITADTARGAYARCLIRLAEMTLTPAARQPAPGIYSDSTQLSRRIQMMLETNRNRSTRVSRVGIAAAVILLAGGLFLFAQVSPVIAVAEDESRAAQDQKSRVEDEARKAQDEAIRAHEMSRQAREERLRASEELKRTSEQAKRTSEEMRRQYERMRVLAERSAQELEVESKVLVPPAPEVWTNALPAGAPAPTPETPMAPPEYAAAPVAETPEVPPAPPVAPAAPVAETPGVPAVFDAAPVPGAPIGRPVPAPAMRPDVPDAPEAPEVAPAPEPAPTPIWTPSPLRRPSRAPLPPRSSPAPESLPATEAPELPQ